VDLFRQLLGVGFVFALLGAALLVLRRKGAVAFIPRPKRSGESRELQIVERLALTPQHSLHLVRVKGREILVAVSPSGCSILEKENARG
jgi:flagellar biogenesis protein FliO